MKILDGVKLAEQLLKEVKKSLGGRKLGLAVVQVGDNAVSEKYIQEKRSTCQELGIGFEFFFFPETIGEAELKKEIERIGADSAHSGMIVQLPLPKQLKTQEILDSIPSGKDVDVLGTKSFGSFALGKLSILPPTVGAISLLLQKAEVSLKGKNVVVVGCGRLVGLPAALWLISQGATVSILNSSTKNIGFFTKTADIVVSGVGKKGLISGSMVKKGAIVIDAGTSVEQGATHGDVDFKTVSKKASFITPVPGGVGPLTVAFLLKNLYELSRIHQER